MKLLKTFKGLKPGDILTVRPDAKDFPSVRHDFVSGMIETKTITVPYEFSNNTIKFNGYNWSPEMFVESKKYIWI